MNRFIIDCVLCFATWGLFASPAWAAESDSFAPITDAEWSKIVKAHRHIAPQALTRWRRYVVRDLAERGELPAHAPAELGNRRLAELGYVDVTAAPFNADSAGVKDATAAIQAAIDYAIRHRMAIFVPEGDYRVSDTLDVYQPVTLNADGSLSRSGEANLLEGFTAAPGRRSRIVLSPRSPGFGDPAKPKLVLYVHNVQPPAAPGDTKAEKQGSVADQSPREANSVTYDQIVCGIDITIGEGNAGAVALRLQGAEGCSLQDITVDATHGHVGVWGVPGSGGSTHKLTVIGGDIGVETRQWPDRNKIGCQPSPSFSGLTLVNQRQYAMAVQTRGACIAVGCRFARNTPGPLLLLHRHWFGQPYDGSLGLVDCQIEYDKPAKENIAVENVADERRSFYFNNVYLKNATAVDTIAMQAAGSGGWHRFRELAVSLQPADWNGRTFMESIVIDGRPLGRDRLVDEQPGEAPPADLISRHVLPSLPAATWPSAVSIRRYADRVADGDWAPAIQAAVNEHQVVAIPHGKFPVRSTVRLKPSTKLVGVQPTRSVIVGEDDPGRRFAGVKFGGNDAQPIIATADDAKADTVIAFLGICTHNALSAHSPEPLACYPLLWRAGGNSVVDMLDYGNERREGKQYWMAFTMRLHFRLADVPSPATDPTTGLKLASVDPRQPRLFAESGQGRKKSADTIVALTTPFGRDGCGLTLNKDGKAFNLEELQLCNATFDEKPAFAVTIVGKSINGQSLEKKVDFAADSGPARRLEPRTVTLDWKQLTEASILAPRPFGLNSITSDGKKTEFAKIKTAQISLQRNDMRRGFEHFPFSPNVHPMILITGNGGGRWYNFWRHGDIWAQEGYRQVLVKDNKSPLHIYHWHLQHVHSAAQAGFQNARDVSVYGIKHEHQTCFLEVVDSDRIRIFGSGGMSNAAPDSAHFRFINTQNFLLSNLADEIHIGMKDANKHTPRNPLVQNDPSRYAGVQEIVGKQTLTDRQEDSKKIDRPILWRRGQPFPDTSRAFDRDTQGRSR